MEIAGAWSKQKHGPDRNMVQKHGAKRTMEQRHRAERSMEHAEEWN
jgi:hypothetical protein